jgi:hypothetical protein
MSLSVPLSSLDPVLVALVYLAVGVAVWILLDPTAYADSLVRAYARRGTSPTAAVMALMILAVIVAWPDIVAARLARARGRR